MPRDTRTEVRSGPRGAGGGERAKPESDSRLRPHSDPRCLSVTKFFMIYDLRSVSSGGT